MPTDNFEDHLKSRPLPRETASHDKIAHDTEELSPKNIAKLITACYAVVSAVERTDVSDEAIDFLDENQELWQDLEEYFPGISEVAEYFVHNGDIDEDMLHAFSLGLRTFSNRYKLFSGSIPNARTWFNNLRSYLSTRKDVYRMYLDRAAADPVYPAWVEKTFAVDAVETQEDIQEDLRDIVHSWNGDDSIFIKSKEEEKRMAAEKPELWKMYQEATKEFTHSWMTYVAAFVRERGEKLASYDELLDEMEENGFESDLPIGFHGYIDSNSNIYTMNGEKINMRPRKRYTPVVIMNKNPSIKGVFKIMNWEGKTEDIGVKNTFYTEKHHKESSNSKFAAVKDFGHVAESIRSRWLRTLTGDSSGHGDKVFAPTDVNQVVALVIELIWMTAARIGNPENSTGGEKTYGLSTVLVNQVRFNQNSVSIRYQGKDAVTTKHVIRAVDPVTTYVINALKILSTYGGKKGSDYLFTYVTRQGRQRRISDSLVNKELKGFYSVPSGFTIHNIRTYHGTKIFEEQLEKAFNKYKDLTPKGGKELINMMAMEVGKKLNHVRRGVDGEEEITPVTALTNYIDFNVQAKFYEHYGLPMPAYLTKKLGRTLTASPFLETDAFEPATDSIDDSLMDTTVENEEQAFRTDDAPESVPEEEANTDSAEEETSDTKDSAEEDPTAGEAGDDAEVGEDTTEENGTTDTEDAPDSPDNQETSSTEEDKPKEEDTKNSEENNEETVQESVDKERQALEDTLKPTPLSTLAEELLLKPADAILLT